MRRPERGAGAAFFGVAGASVGMHQNRLAGKAAGGRRHRVAELAEQHLVSRRHAGGMRLDFPVEYVNFAVRAFFAQMVIGAAIAKAAFQNNAGFAGNLSRRPVQTGALRFEAADETIDAAHG